MRACELLGDRDAISCAQRAARNNSLRSASASLTIHFSPIASSLELSMKWSLALSFFLLVLPSGEILAQKSFGFDNRKASGQDYISAEESVKRFAVPPGWEVTVFATEPDVINPIAFSIDERGRLWVVECFEYPSRTPKGQKPRDRIK